MVKKTVGRDKKEGRKPVVGVSCAADQDRKGVNEINCFPFPSKQCSALFLLLQEEFPFQSNKIDKLLC